MGGFESFFSSTKSWIFLASLGPILRHEVISGEHACPNFSNMDATVKKTSWCYHENDRDDPFSGTYNGNLGDGKTINVYGFAVAKVNEKLQIENIEVPDIILI